MQTHAHKDVDKLQNRLPSVDFPSAWHNRHISLCSISGKKLCSEPQGCHRFNENSLSLSLCVSLGSALCRGRRLSEKHCTQCLSTETERGGQRGIWGPLLALTAVSSSKSSNTKQISWLSTLACFYDYLAKAKYSFWWTLLSNDLSHLNDSTWAV